MQVLNPQSVKSVPAQAESHWREPTRTRDSTIQLKRSPVEDQTGDLRAGW